MLLLPIIHELQLMEKIKTNQMSRSWHLFRKVPDKNSCSYLNVLLRFNKISQTVAAMNKWRTWIGFFQPVEDELQPKPVWRARKRKVPPVACTPFILFIFFLFPFQLNFCMFLTRYMAPIDPVSARGLAYGCEGVGSEHQWQSNQYSAGASTKLSSPCVKIPQYQFKIGIPVLCVLHHLLRLCVSV